MPDMEEVYRITRLGNPAKPQGEEGVQMLERMNESHYDVTGWALDFWKLGENDRVLDIGCGGGVTLRRMAGKVTGGRLTGVDYSEVSVKLSAQTNSEYVQRGKMDIIQASVEKLPFSDGSFDKIITVESFYFWPDPAENLKEVLRVLKKGGKFLLVADIYGKEGLSEQTLENVKQFHLFNPTKEQFYELFKNAGFTDIAIYTQEGTDWICVSGSR